ncbi:MAG: glycoside hydrolase family 15 protein [Alphaproteobacteria bacterium]
MPWLAGYEGSRPVRIGNAAHQQLQLDVYGEVMDALHQGPPRRPFRRRVRVGPAARAARSRRDHLARARRRPWEVRGPRQHFTYSKAMVWVAFDRTIKSAEQFGMPGDVARWKGVRQRICEDVLRHGYDAELGSFVRAYGSKDLDASLLLLPAIGLLPPEDPRIRGTVRAVERSLFRDGFVLRYDTASAEDGLPPGEGAFLACSFWLADAYVLLGRMDDARRLFERLIALRNDVGLLSEEYDVGARRLVGNFPQAFSHLALVNTAANLTKAAKPRRAAGGTDARCGGRTGAMTRGGGIC